MLPFLSCKAWSTIRGYHSALQDCYKGIDLLADITYKTAHKCLKKFRLDLRAAG